MRDLADRTGMTTPSLYNAFGDKRAIYRLVLDRYVRLTLDTCSAIFGSDDPPLRQLARHFDATVEEALADSLHKGCFVVNTALEVAPHVSSFGPAGAAPIGRAWCTTIPRTGIVHPLVVRFLNFFRPGHGGVASLRRLPVIAGALITLIPRRSKAAASWAPRSCSATNV